VDDIQRAAFGYFTEFADPATGLVPDTSAPGSPSSIACIGFGLSCYPIGVERGWMARDAAADLTLATLRFLFRAEQGDQADAAGHKGFFYHFLDMTSGRRAGGCELSTLDTSLLFGGVLAAAGYWSGPGAAEREIRELADRLYRRVDWQWAQDGDLTITQGWRPESGFILSGWEGFNEAMLLFVLGLGSPTRPLPESAYGAWVREFQWENIYDIPLLFAGPLFIHYFSHAWIDFRGIRDPLMRNKGSDYFENTRRAIAVQREYCRRNPKRLRDYGLNFWGISAGEGPTGQLLREDIRDRNTYGYSARGVPYGPDDGTVSPWSMPAALPFAPEAAVAGARNLIDNYPRAVPGGRFSSGFNLAVEVDGEPWRTESIYGLDQGIVAMAIENFRSGLIWRIMRASPYLRKGLERAGFTGGWLEAAEERASA
jgi:hypothetical protein